MADPHHVPVLDAFDRTTVRLYRLGLVLAAVGLLVASVVLVAGAVDVLPLAWLLVTVGTSVAVLDVHLYDKRIRWILSAFGWAGVVLQVAAPTTGAGAHLVSHAGLGFLFAALSGFALKERFCFRLPGLRWVPALLATSLLPLVLGAPTFAAALLLPAGLLYVVLAVAKLRMPLHFDVGDKSRYQV